MPVMLISLISRSDVPVFLIVIVFCKLPPNFTFPKLTETGRAEIRGGGADPKSFTLTVGVVGALDEMLMVAALLPKEIGANVTVAAQKLLGVSTDVQSFV